MNGGDADTKMCLTLDTSALALTGWVARTSFVPMHVWFSSLWICDLITAHDSHKYVKRSTGPILLVLNVQVQKNKQTNMQAANRGSRIIVLEQTEIVGTVAHALRARWIRQLIANPVQCLNRYSYSTSWTKMKWSSQLYVLESNWCAEVRAFEKF